MARSTKKPKDALPSEPKVTDVTADQTSVAADATNATDGVSDKGTVASKSATSKTAKVEDAIILGNDSMPSENASSAADTPKAASKKNDNPTKDAGRVDPVPPVSETASGTSDADATSRMDTPQDANGDTAVAVVPAAEASRGSGFVALLMGGVLAGAIGFLAALYLAPDSEAPALEAERLDALAAELDALKAADASPPTDLAPIETAQVDLTERLDELTARIEIIETRDSASADATPVPAVDSSTTGIDALRAEIGEISATSQALGSDIQTLRGDVELLSTDLEARISAVETGLAEANSLAASVENQADTLARETARNQIRLALQSGAPYAEPLALLGDAPTALAENAEAGVPSQSDLIAEFPDLSRAALRSARTTTESAGVGSLFRNAFNPRSLEPREGDDPDAVLSRAEAAVRDGNLQAALTEIETLPADAQAVLQDWTTRARSRAAALAAADDYLQDG